VFWEELHHQGDAVRLHSQRFHFSSGVIKNEARLIGTPMPLSRSSNWHAKTAKTRTFRRISGDYFQAIGQLAEIGTTEVLKAETAEDVRAILSIIAITRGLRIHGKILVNYSEDELVDIESMV
jgi:hypothetical protein